MDCTQAKKISIIGFLASIGIKPHTVKNRSAWYNSPFRNETKPSFKVDRNLNVWYDFGSGTGGTVLDLVMQLHNTGIPGALLVLQQPELSKRTFSYSQQQNSILSSIQIKLIQPIQNRALLQYLANRQISKSKAINYVQEAHYEVNNKQYYAIAFKNDQAGFELRNKYFKGGSSPKTITTIKGNQEAVNIFEGFIDFLSALEYYNICKPANTTIILNSVSNLNHIFNLLPNFNSINLFLDNDVAGKQAAQKIKSKFDKVQNYAELIYPEYKDFNELLTSKN